MVKAVLCHLLFLWALECKPNNSLFVCCMKMFGLSSKNKNNITKPDIFPVPVLGMLWSNNKYLHKEKLHNCKLLVRNCFHLKGQTAFNSSVKNKSPNSRFEFVDISSTNIRRLQGLLAPDMHISVYCNHQKVLSLYIFTG